MQSAQHPSPNELEAFAKHELPRERCEVLFPHFQDCSVCRIALAATRADAPDSTIVEVSFDVDFSQTGPTRETQSARFGPPEALIGKTVGDYVIEEALGLGGMGVVYKARHPLIGKVVAIKVLRAELAQEPANVQALLAEARSAALIDHDAIVDIYAVGHLDDGRQYLVMEYLAGEPLNKVLKRQTRLPLSKALQVIDRILSALEAAHEAGIVHRDIKPSNLFLNRDRDGSVSVKLLDFGLARAPRTDTGETRIRGVALGSPAYMSPEQVRGESVDQRADLYALGVLMYEMTTGERPFRSQNLLELLTMQIEVPPQAPRELVPDLSPALEQLILSLLEKDRDKRPANATEVRSALRRLRHNRTVRTPVVPATPEATRWRWLPALIVGLAVVVVVLAGFLMPANEVSAIEAQVDAGAAVALVEPPPNAVNPVVEPPPAVVEAEVDAGPVARPPPPTSVERPKVRRADPRPPPPSLVEKALALRRRIIAHTPRGEEPDPMALMLLKRTEDAAANARSAEEREKVEQMLRDISRNYLPR